VGPIKLHQRAHYLIEQTLKGRHYIRFDDTPASFVKCPCKIIWVGCLFSRQIVDCLLDLNFTKWVIQYIFMQNKELELCPINYCLPLRSRAQHVA
jgi:hypothetical protein